VQPEDEISAARRGVDRATLIRDVALLQVKLVVDGLRDFILVPVSLITGVISLFRMGDPAGTEFYRLLRIGRRSERWINLFAAAEHVAIADEEPDHFPDADIDELVGRLETFVRDEAREGEMSRQARSRLNSLLEALRQRRRNRGR
jgi:hypothetical protein